MNQQIPTKPLAKVATVVAATTGPALLLTLLRAAVNLVHNFLHNNKFAPYLVEIAGLALAVFIGFAVHRHYEPHLVTTQVNDVIKTVTVDKPVLTEKIVTQVLPDPKDKATIQSLLAENAALKVNVTELTETVAGLKQTGGTHDGGTLTAAVQNPVGTTPDPGYNYKDWHLTFWTDGKTADYTLNQQFEVLHTSGRDKTGKPISVVSLFELGGTGERIPITTGMKTVGIFADATTPHWMFGSLNIQGGLAVTRDTGKSENGGLIAVQWLKHGRTKAAEDVSYAILSPSVFLSSGAQDIGLLPFSINLGRIPRQPLTNLWISPFVSKTPRVGVVISATF